MRSVSFNVMHHGRPNQRRAIDPNQTLACWRFVHARVTPAIMPFLGLATCLCRFMIADRPAHISTICLQMMTKHITHLVIRSNRYTITEVSRPSPSCLPELIADARLRKSGGIAGSVRPPPVCHTSTNNERGEEEKRSESGRASKRAHSGISEYLNTLSVSTSTHQARIPFRPKNVRQ